MSNLKFDREKSNLGGLSGFKFMYEKQLLFPIEIIRGQAINISLITDFIEPDITFSSASLTENIKGVNLFEYQYTANVAQDDIEKLNDCVRIDNNKVIAIVKDNNNQSRLLGQLANACIMEIGFEKGRAVTDVNTYVIKLIWKSRTRAPFANNLYVVTDKYQFEGGQFFEFD